jgi:hypothetical protein
MQLESTTTPRPHLCRCSRTSSGEDPGPVLTLPSCPARVPLAPNPEKANFHSISRAQGTPWAFPLELTPALAKTSTLERVLFCLLNRVLSVDAGFVTVTVLPPQGAPIPSSPRRKDRPGTGVNLGFSDALVHPIRDIYA